MLDIDYLQLLFMLIIVGFLAMLEFLRQRAIALIFGLLTIA
ncbi:hypothetical protein [[Phormidium ambiguum] IAM M-71]|nr:hypothetical protein [Phormidium ambiguum]